MIDLCNYCGASKPELVNQIASAASSGSMAKTASVDASLRDLRQVRDGLSGQASQRDELDKRLTDCKLKDQSIDVSRVCAFT